MPVFQAFFSWYDTGLINTFRYISAHKNTVFLIILFQQLAFFADELYAARHVIRVEPFDVYFLLSQDLRDRIQQFLHPLTGMGRGGNALLRAEVAGKSGVPLSSPVY